MDCEYKAGDYVLLDLSSDKEVLVQIKTVLKTNSCYAGGGKNIYLFRGIEYKHIDCFFSELLEFNFYDKSIIRRANEIDMSIAVIKGKADFAKI